MADDLGYTQGSGANVATDDVGGRHFQRVKVAHGGDGTADDASASTPLPVREPTGVTAALSNVNDSASSAQLLASNTARKGMSIFNDSTQPLFVKFGTTASVTDYTVKIVAGGYYEMPKPIYTGRVDGIWAADASGAARITELT